MARKASSARQVITANRLGDGAVVYLREDRTWTEWVDESYVAAGAEEGEALLAAIAETTPCRVADTPYLIDVDVDAGKVVPTRYRERIRAGGPSVHPGFGKQADVRTPAELEQQASAKRL